MGALHVSGKLGGPWQINLTCPVGAGNGSGTAAKLLLDGTWWQHQCSEPVIAQPATQGAGRSSGATPPGAFYFCSLLHTSTLPVLYRAQHKTGTGAEELSCYT